MVWTNEAAGPVRTHLNIHSLQEVRSVRSVSRGSKLLALGLVVATVGVASCGKKSSSSSLPPQNTSCPTSSPAPKPLAAPTVPVSAIKPGGTVTYASDQEPTGWNVQTATDATADTAYLETGVWPQTFIVKPDYSVVMDSNLLLSATQTSSSPQTIVYKMNPKAKWSDGVPINAQDFIYNWQMQNGTISNVDAASTTGYDQIKSVTGSDNGETITVVFKTPYPDWKSLFINMIPQHVYKNAAGWGTVDKDGNASGPMHNAAAPTVSGGVWKLQNYQPKKSVELVPNTAYWGAKPLIDKIIVRFDVTDLAPAFQNGEINFAYPQPQLDIVNQFKQQANLKTFVNFGLSFEHIDMNLGNPLLKQLAVRQAINYGLNRYELVKKTVGQFDGRASTLENRMWVNNQAEYVAHANACTDFNPSKAVKILEAAGYKKGSDGYYAKDGKELSFKIITTGGNLLREQTEQIIVDQLQKVGIKIVIANKPGSAAFDPITSKQYDLALFAWVAAPFPSSNVSIYTTGGGQNWTNYSNKQEDALLKDMATTPDHATEIKDSQAADKILWQDLPTIPLYQKPTLLAYTNNLLNVRDDASVQGPLWNAQEWGTAKAQ